MYRNQFDSITGKDRQYVVPGVRRNRDGSRAVDGAGVELPLHEPSDDVLARLARPSNSDQA